VAYTRSTTVADTLDERRALEAWMQREVVVGLAMRPDLLALAQSVDRDERDELNRICEQARQAAAVTAKANEGTARHKLTERIDRGEAVRVPAQLTPDIDAYRAATAGFVWLAVERMVVLDADRVAGTPDRLALVDERPTVVDLKCGRDLSYSWRAIAVQLASYAHGERYDPATGARSPLPDGIDVDSAVVVHLPAGEGRCELHRVDIASGWEAYRLALEVRRWRQRRNLARAYESPVLEAVDPAIVDALRARMTALDDHARAALGALVAEAAAAGVDFRPSGGATPQRVACYMAALAVVEQLDADDTATRCALATATGEGPQRHPLGALLGALTIEHAGAVVRLLDELAAGARHLIVVDDDTYSFPTVEVLT